MKPLRLEFQAFGPYVSRQIIDFTRFADGQIFLINGETGSGKTTIIDAMVFALYDEGSGSDRKKLETMKSFNIGAEDIPTEVVFDFEASGMVYRFSRKCYTKKKRNGTEEPKEEAAAYILKNGDFIPVFENPRISDVTNYAKEIIKLDKDQFTQIMILPQGKFEKFLLADSGEKEKLLGTLFNVEKWGKIAEWLYFQGDGLKKEKKELEIKSRGMCENEGCENISQLKDKLEKAENGAKTTWEALKEAEKGKKTAEENYEKAKKTVENFEAARKAEEEFQRVKRKAPEIESLKQTVEKNLVAMKIKPYYENCVKCYRKLKEREGRLKDERELETNQNELKKVIDKQGNEFENKKAGIDKEREKAKILSENRSVYENIQKFATEKDKTEKKKNEADIKKQAAEKQVQAAEEALRTAEEKRKNAYAQRDKIVELSERKNQVENLRKALNEKKITEKKLSDCREQYKKASELFTKKTEEYENAKKDYEKLYEFYLNNLASELSSELAEGKPCPVCGSVHHPAPFAFNGERVGKEALSRAKSAMDKLLEEKTASGNEATRLRVEYNAASNEFEKICREISGMKAFSEEEQEMITNEYKNAVSAEKQVAEIDGKIKRLNDVLEKARESEKACTEEFSAAKAAFSEQEKTLAQLMEAVEKEAVFSGIKTAAQLDMAIKECETKISQYEKAYDAYCKSAAQCEKDLYAAQNAVKTALYEVEEAKREYERAVAEYKEKMAENGLVSREEYEKYLVEDEAEIKGKQRIIEDFNASCKALDKAFRDAEAKISGVSEPDITACEKLRIEAESKVDELTRENQGFENERKRLSGLVDSYSKLESEISKLEESSERLMSFAKDLRGDNGIGIRRHVLRIMLEQVIFEANRILSQIKGGQFRLIISNEKASGKRQYGLDLLVESTKTTKPYSVKSLSGGEKFLVAMALSLALASTVRNNSAGVTIDALFIDEGFGTLSFSALDEAIQVLLTMSGGRKTIGIISHVEALKETIPAKINVISGARGSQLEIDM